MSRVSKVYCLPVITTAINNLPVFVHEVSEDQRGGPRLAVEAVDQHYAAIHPSLDKLNNNGYINNNVNNNNN